MFLGKWRPATEAKPPELHSVLLETNPIARDHATENVVASERPEPVLYLGIFQFLRNLRVFVR